MKNARTTIDLNCDMGELPHLLMDGTEEALMQEISSANIACGGHAGSVGSMQALVKLAMKYGVAVGAHVSYPDRTNFGRKEVPMSADEIEETVHSQISILANVAAELGTRVHHVKPHGALYHAAQKNEAIATAIANAAHRFDKTLVLVEQASTAVLLSWSKRGHPTKAEAFADRTYEEDGKLRSRDLPGALITDPALAAAQAVGIARDHIVMAGDGSRLRLEAQTICLHGDTPGAVGNAKAIKIALRDAGVTLAAYPQH
jgi:UPF0271 protein